MVEEGILVGVSFKWERGSVGRRELLKETSTGSSSRTLSSISCNTSPSAPTRRELEI